jgi:hydrogenase large subunit
MVELRIDPVSRIEGHLDIKVEIDDSGDPGVSGVVVDAHCSATMFRGFEKILQGRDPRDAIILTQRICGVCPVAHAMASTKNLDSAYGVTPADNGRRLRNLVLGANTIMSHILHLYHLSALDYIDTATLAPPLPPLNLSPFIPSHTLGRGDTATGALATTLVGQYVKALAMRRKAQEMGAIFCGKLPCHATFVPGGNTQVVTKERIDNFRALLDELRAFIFNASDPLAPGTYIGDVVTVAGVFGPLGYWNIGVGCGNLMSYGVYDLDGTGTNKLLQRGTFYTDKLLHFPNYFTEGPYDDALFASRITEYTHHSWYNDADTDLNPSVGVTNPDVNDVDAYSWAKSPRLRVDETGPYGPPAAGKVYEVGPLARMVISYLAGNTAVQGLVDFALGALGKTIPDLFSPLGRHAARALECKIIADAMDGWLDELEAQHPNYGPVVTQTTTPTTASGIGLTDAPRGAVAHWIDIAGGVIDRYQVITPTAWNVSPRDDTFQLGPIEQTLIGTPVADINNPLEVLRQVHAFDCCIACTVHVVTPGGDTKRFVVNE